VNCRSQNESKMVVVEREAKIREMAYRGSCHLGFDIMTNDPLSSIPSFIGDVILG
jgi:hypothetical protein